MRLRSCHSSLGTGLLYCLGIAFADLILPGATVLNFWAAFAALAGSGFLAGLFGAVQSVSAPNTKYALRVKSGNGLHVHLGKSECVVRVVNMAVECGRARDR